MSEMQLVRGHSATHTQPYSPSPEARADKLCNSFAGQMATTSFAVHVHTYFAYGGLTPRGSRHSQQDIAPGVSPTDRSKIRLLYELNGSQREQRVAPPPLPLSFVSAATNIEDYIDYYDSEDVKCALCNAYIGRVTAFTENPLV